MKPRTHNLISYVFALLVFAGIYSARASAASAAPLAGAAVLGALMWCLHFARRSAESAWVHRYSKPKVPTSDVVVEYIYYWGFAAWNAISLTSPSYRGPGVVFLGLGGALFLLAELGNSRAHLMLRDLRPAGSTQRVIPRGFLFDRVSSPHYLCEILAWAGFALVTQTWAALAFLVVGTGIVASWAHNRHVAYLKEFDGLNGRERYPASRRALVPGLF